MATLQIDNNENLSWGSQPKAHARIVESHDD